MSGEDSQFCGCLYFTANALARTLTKMAEEEFSITGLSPSYAFVLKAVNRTPGIQPKTLSQEMMLTPSTITRFVDKLEAKGYLTRKSEGRTSLLFPTQKSLDLAETIQVAWSNLYNRYSAMMGEEFAKNLTVHTYQASKDLEPA